MPDEPITATSQETDLSHSELAAVLAILPEGTRSRVGQWKLGFYHIAVGAGVPLLALKFDYGHKVLEFGPIFHPTGSLEADLPQIQAIFHNVKGKNPQNYGI